MGAGGAKGDRQWQGKIYLVNQLASKLKCSIIIKKEQFWRMTELLLWVPKLEFYTVLNRVNSKERG